MGDQIDKAIGAASSNGRERRTRVEFALPTGRQVVVDVPSDMSLDEFRALLGFVAIDMPRALAEAPQAAPGSGIVPVKRPPLVVAR